MNENLKRVAGELFQCHEKTLCSFFRKKVRVKDQAEDLAQEVYLRMLRVRDIDAICNPEAYLFTIASNLLKEHYVAESRRTSIGLEIDDVDQIAYETPAHEDGIATCEHMAMIKSILMDFKPKCRAVIILKYDHGMSYQEIADQLSISTNMVKKYLVQGLFELRQRMLAMR